MMRLGRQNYNSVKYRYKLLISKETTKMKMWTLEEDEKMVQYFLNASTEKDPKKFMLEKNLKECSELGKILGRTPTSCFCNWNYILLPILKTHVKGLPFDMNWNWKENVIQYIITEKIEHPQDIDYHLLIHDVCPGQTLGSLKIFISNRSKIRYRSKRK